MTTVLPIRSADKDDLAFIFGFWSDTYRESPWAGAVPNHQWRDVSHEMIRGLLARGATVLVAYNPRDWGQLVGFCCFERPPAHEPVLHYVAVKDAFRGLGIAGELLKAAGFRSEDPFHYTHRTHLGSRAIKGGIFSPAIARRKERPEGRRKVRPIA